MRNFKNKIILIILSLVFIFSIYGCNSTEIIDSRVDGEPFVASVDKNEYVKIGIISDTQFENRTDDNYEAPKIYKKALQKFSEEKVDAVIYAGDIVHYAHEVAYGYAKNIYEEVLGKNVPLMALMGNHEYRDNGSTGSDTNEAYQQKFKTAFNTELHYIKEIKGYPFIVVSQDKESAANPFTPETKKWLQDTLSQANTKYSGPIFVVSHAHAKDTVNGSEFEYGYNTEMFDILKNYPRVVYFSGHSHDTLFSERAIHQEYFTSINTGAMTGVCYNASNVGNPEMYEGYKYGEGMIMTIGGNKVNFGRYVFPLVEETAKAAPDWTIYKPFTKENFSYTENRKLISMQAKFAADAKPTNIAMRNKSLQFSFPNAIKSDGLIERYKIELTDDSGATLLTTKLNSNFFKGEKYMGLNKFVKTDINGFVVGKTYNVKITPIDCFNLEGAPLSFEIVNE